MKTYITVLIFTILLFGDSFVNAQMSSKEYNYTTFTSVTTPQVTDELKKLTPQEFQSHPEFGILPYGAPCDDCYELIQDRKESERMFVKKGTKGTYFYSQGIYGVYHFEENGYKMSYDPRLKPLSTGIYKSNRLYVATILNVNERYSALEMNNESFKFNNKIELILIKTNNVSENLGQANWSNHTVGDEGIYIKNAWPGIDITISYQFDRIKLNYIIPQPLSYLQDVQKLVFSDKIELPNGYTMTPENFAGVTDQGYIGNYLIRNGLNQEVFKIKEAFAYDNNDLKDNIVFLNYTYTGDVLDLAVPKTWLNTATYPIVIDPLITTNTVYGPGTMNFRYNGAWCGLSGSCDYNLSTSRPANSTLTDVRFNAMYTSSGSCWRNEAAFKIVGPCGTSPAPAATFWNCNNTSAGDCSATGLSIFAETSSCTTPVCSAVLTYTMQNSYCYSSTSGCVASCQVMPVNSWAITVEGRTVETPAPASLNPSPCTGNVPLTAAPSFGVPGYTYVWSTGATSQSINVANAGMYSVVVTDACGQTATQQFTIACPLNIDLGFFNVVRSGEKALVMWETLNESNNDYFTIERLTDVDKGWEALGTVNGNGNFSGSIAYKFYDNAPYKRGVSYYRLKQTDFGGETFTFEPKMVDFSDSEIRIYPQPASDKMIVEWGGFEGEIQFYSLLGEKLNVKYNMDGKVYVFDTSNLSSGIYTLVFVVDGKAVSIQKVIVK